MPLPLQRYGFAAAVTAGLALMAVVVVGKSLFSGADEAAAAKGPGGPGGALVEVVVQQARAHVFSDGIQAIGTAQSRESIVITPKVADAIRSIRFESGDRVQRGQVLVELASVEQQADIAEAIAARDAAQRELARFQELFDRGFLPRARLDATQAAFDAADARVRAGQSRAADRTIRAPFAGVVGLRTASPGQYAQPGDALGTLDDVSQIKLDFDVAEAQISRLREGVAIVATTTAYPGEEFTGQIEQVDSRVAAQTRTVRVRAILPNRDERLRPGMLMNVIIRSNPREAIAVPETAIIDEANGVHLFTVAAGENGPIVAQRAVQTGQRSGGMIEITGGLQEGQQVIVEGVQRVRDGQAVRLAAAPAPAPPPAIRGREGEAAAPAAPETAEAARTRAQGPS